MYAYIGVALVIGLLIGFVTLSIIWLSKRVSRDIRSKTIDVISSYDALLRKRSQELAELEEKLRKTADVAPVETVEPEQTEHNDLTGVALLSAAERIGSAAYLDAGVSETYRKIRGGFSVSPIAALRQVMGVSGDYVQGPASQLLKQLPYETVYRLSTLSEEEQRQLLETTFDDESIALLQAYCESHRRFDAIGFYDYLVAVAEMEPRPPRLRVSPVFNGPYPPGIEVVVDPDICEGFQIEAGNILYDYCIKGKELS